MSGPAERFRVVPAAYLLLRRGDQVLLQLRARTGWRDGYWSAAAAGHVEAGEPVAAAICREAAEELGVGIDPLDLTPLTALHRTARTADPLDERVDFFFAARRWTGQPRAREGKASAVAWFDLGALPDAVVPHERHVLQHLRDATLPPILSFGFARVTVVAAIARGGVIGRDGGLPWRIPADLRRVKRLTMGHVLLMGRRTYESIGRPLPGRTTVVVTRQPHWTPPGTAGEVGTPPVHVVGSAARALDVAAQFDREVFVLGGAEVFRTLVPLADRLEITHVDADPPGDTWFPPVDWGLWERSAHEDHDGYAFATYDRRPATPREYRPSSSA